MFYLLHQFHMPGYICGESMVHPHNISLVLWCSSPRAGWVFLPEMSMVIKSFIVFTILKVRIIHVNLHVFQVSWPMNVEISIVGMLVGMEYFYARLVHGLLFHLRLQHGWRIVLYVFISSMFYKWEHSTHFDKWRTAQNLFTSIGITLCYILVIILQH